MKLVKDKNDFLKKKYKKFIEKPNKNKIRRKTNYEIYTNNIIEYSYTV